MRISDWSSDVCSSDLGTREAGSATFACGGNAFGGSALRCCFGSIAAAEAPPTHPPPQAGEGRSCRAGIASKAFAAIRRDVASFQSDYPGASGWRRSEEHTSELQSLMRHSYAVFCLK